MNRDARLLLLLAASVGLFVIAGCSDEDSIVDPPPFQVVIEITGRDGAPVPGLELGLAPDTPLYQDGKRAVAAASLPDDRLGAPYPSPFFPAVIVRYELDEPRSVRLTIEDVAGGLVAVLVDEARPAGSHSLMWAGRSDGDEAVPSGVYLARLVARDIDSGEVVLEQARPMLLAAFYADQYRVGTTDLDGRIEIADQRLFPYLYGLPEFDALDETGQPSGTIILTPTVRFHVSDPATGQILRFDGDVTGSTTLRFTWDPAP